MTGSATVPVHGGAGKRRKRPAAVTVVAIVVGCIALAHLAGGVALLVQESVTGDGVVETLGDDALTKRDQAVADGIYYTGVALFGFALLYGFLHSRRWAWAALMTWAAFNLAVGLVRWVLGSPAYVSLALSVVVVLTLNQSDIQKAFGIARENDVDESLVQPSRNPIDGD